MNGPRLAAEALGTFMLVFIGSGASAVNAWSHGAVTHVGIALAFGLVILAAVYLFGHISGAHFNPAVTVGFWLGGRFPGREVMPYASAQISGAIAAAGILRMILGSYASAGATRPTIGVLPSLGIEFLLTFFLMLAIMAVATDARVTGSVGGLVVGATVGFDALMGGPLTGASMNPARSFGPALTSGVWSAHWVYWLGPLVGAAAAVYTYDYLRRGSFDGHR